jgi:methyl-accepting chemotaxis protein
MSGEDPVHPAFIQVIEKLKHTTESLDGLTEPMTKVSTDIDHMDGFMSGLHNFDSGVDAVSNIVGLVANLLPLLDAIPIVGEIASGMQTVMNDVKFFLGKIRKTLDQADKDIIQPLKKVLDKAKKATHKFQEIFLTLTHKIPEFLTTIEILYYVAQIASPLVSILKGNDASDRLAKLVGNLTNTRDAVMSALEPFEGVFSTIKHAVAAVVTFIKGVLEKVSGPVQTAIDALTSVAHTLQPVVDTVNSVIDAIKPVRWALDAVSSIIEKVLMPVINWILEKTGLKSLFDSIEHEIMKQLHFDEVLNMITGGNLGTSAVDTNVLGEGHAGEIATKCEDLFKLLLQYRQNGGTGDVKSGVTKIMVAEFISAITGTEIDPNKPASIPDFPTLPNVPTASPTVSVVHLMAVGVPHPFSISKGQRLKAMFKDVSQPRVAKPRTPIISFISMSPTNAVTPPDFISKPIDQSKWPKCYEALQKIDQLSGTFESLPDEANKISLSLSRFSNSLNLSSSFGDQVDLTVSLFTSATELTQLVSQFKIDWLSPIIDPVEQVIVDQNTLATDVKAKVPLLHDSITKFMAYSATAFEEFVKSDRNQSVLFNGVLARRLNGWRLGIRQLIAMIERGSGQLAYITAGPKKDQAEANLKDLASQLESNAGSLSERLGKLESAFEKILQIIHTIEGQLEIFSKNLAAVGEHSNIIDQKAIPTLQKVKNIMGTVASIVDPLIGLLEAAKCVDSGNPSKVIASGAVTAMIDKGKQSIPPASFKQLGVELVDSTSPLGQLEKCIATTVESLSTTEQTFTGECADLKEKVTSLENELAATQKYSFKTTLKKEDGSVEVITHEMDNDLIDQYAVEKALQVIIALTPQPNL